jgi:hypothetical protein
LAVAREQASPVGSAAQRTPAEPRSLNAQQVTSIAMAFLKSLGHKRGIKPTRVFVENQRYVVEVEIGKKTLANVQVDPTTSEIKAYAIERKPEEPAVNLPVEPRAMIIMFGISVAVSLIFALLNLQAALSGLM